MEKGMEYNTGDQSTAGASGLSWTPASDGGNLAVGDGTQLTSGLPPAYSEAPPSDGQNWNAGQPSGGQYSNYPPTGAPNYTPNTGYAYGNPYSDKGPAGGAPAAVGVPVTNVTQVVYPGQPVVVVQLGKKPHNFMWLSCLVFWFCCWPLGAAGIYYSSSSTSAYTRGWQDLAVQRAKTALYLSIAGLIGGIITLTTIIILALTVFHRH